MFYTRYQGEFLDIKGNIWKVCIQQDVASPFASVGELELSAGSSLEIEWPESSQEESIAGSSATLRLVSPDDRTYLDLYSIGICEFRLLVYRNNTLYWSGTLDPEFSEEPYSRARNYEVLLTFSDFGVLDRIPYGLSGRQTIEAVLLEALSRACLSYSNVDESLISTYLGQTRATLDKLAIQSENFFDEDGEAMSYREALESLLQPLGMKMIQRNGIIYIYDLNGLYQGGTVRPISWALEDQRISSDKVFNNIKISLSTYAQKSSTPEFKYTGKYSASQINLTSDPKSDGEYYSYYEDYGEQPDEHWDYNNVDFTIFLGQAQGLADKHPSAAYFHILPVLGSEESEGVAIWFYTGGHGSLASGFPVRKRLSTVPAAGTMLLKTQKIYLPPLSSNQAAAYRLRIALDMLMDTRYNPFVEASTDNESGNYKKQAAVATAYVPVKVQLYDASGTVVKHFENKSIATRRNATCTLAGTMGSWANGAAAYDDCLLQWYDPTKENVGPVLTGWRKNRQACGYPRGDIYDSFKKIDDGQYLPYPESGGYLEVTVCGGMTVHDATTYPSTIENDVLMPLLRWMLFKAPTIEILKDGIATENIDTNDVEYTGVLNPSAKDSLDIDTVCGTMAVPNPAARALYYKASDGSIVTELTRAGRTTQAEQLLIGTLYSQFAQRRMKLSGTADLDHYGLCCRSDAAQPSGRKFYTTSELQLIREAENSITAVELRPDEYYSEND